MEIIVSGLALDHASALPPVDRLDAQLKHFSTRTIKATAESQAAKASHEAAEFAAEPSLEEAADVLVCLTGWAALTGYSLGDIINAAIDKMVVNIWDRRWYRKPDGTYQHEPDGPMAEVQQMALWAD